MKIKQALIGFLTVSCIYIAVLYWANTNPDTHMAISQIKNSIPILIVLSLLSFFTRFLRWHYLLIRAGYKLAVTQSALAYFTGYAFTATPGKVGELVRIRYLAPLGVPAPCVISAFIFERVFDLLSVLVLGSLFVGRNDILILLIIFVGAFLTVVGFAVFHPSFLNKIADYLKKWKFNRLTRLILVLKEGMAGAKIWLTFKDCLVAFVLGLLAWFLTASSFVYLLNQLQISLPILQALSAYPLAMLAGAASMVPGGIGSAEGVLIALLAVNGVTLSLATVASVGIRIFALWMAVILGLYSLCFLEFQRFRKITI